MLRESRDFIIKGNALQLAIGVILAFGAVVVALTEGVLMAAAAAAVGASVFAVAGGGLYRVDPQTGGSTQLDGTWNTRHVAGCGEHLYLWEHGGTLWWVTPASGAYRQLDGSWERSRAATSPPPPPPSQPPAS